MRIGSLDREGFAVRFRDFGLHCDCLIYGDVVAIAVCNACVKSGNRVICCLKAVVQVEM